MSKNSSKQRIETLKLWIEKTIKKPITPKKNKNEYIKSLY